MARLYDLLFASFIDGFYARIAQRLTAITPAWQVLDVGCGPGRLAVHLARQAPDLTVTGVDILPEMIKLARRRSEAWNLSARVHFQVADVSALPFRDNQFDLVVSTLSLHHWPDPVRGLAEIRRVLKPGGKACIYDLADWIFRLTHHGVRPAEILTESPFASEAIEPVWTVGPVPLVTGFSLGRLDNSLGNGNGRDRNGPAASP
jgi:ubiquinone/menaquinone biosynthesis C-methylase UbiE